MCDEDYKFVGDVGGLKIFIGEPIAVHNESRVIDAPLRLGGPYVYHNQVVQQNFKIGNSEFHINWHSGIQYLEDCFHYPTNSLCVCHENTSPLLLELIDEDSLDYPADKLAIVSELCPEIDTLEKLRFLYFLIEGRDPGPWFGFLDSDISNDIHDYADNDQ